MIYRVLAEGTMLVHFAFLLFVALGGAFVFRWAWVALLHVPAFLWGALISLVGWICPLTPLENRFRRLAGQEGYETGFIEHYIASVVYPEGLTRTHQIVIGVGVLLLNALVYGAIVVRRRRRLANSGRSG